MEPTPLGGLIGLCLGLGFTALYAGFRGGERWNRGVTRRSLRLDQLVPRGALAFLCGTVLGLATGWPVLAVAGAAGGWVLPGAVYRRSTERRRVTRGVALIEFVDLVADMLEGSGQGLESVLKTAAEVAPRPIRWASLALARDLGGRASMAQALSDFSATMDDPICDQLERALLLGESDQLSRVLRAVAATGRAELELRRRIEASRSGLVWTGRLIIGLTVVMGLGMALFDRAYVAPYGTPIGEALLLIVVLLMALAVWAMGRTARIAPSRRLPAASDGEP